MGGLRHSQRTRADDVFWQHIASGHLESYLGHQLTGGAAHLRRRALKVLGLGLKSN